MRSLKEKTLLHLMEQNYLFGKVFYGYGIRFYEYAGQTLEQVCRYYRLDANKVAHDLEAAVSQSHDVLLPRLRNYPLQVVVQYLRGAHRYFINERLPYMNELVAKIDPQLYDEPAVAQDLQLVFPLFIDDFIHHIHEEENTVFRYAERLCLARKGKLSLHKVFLDMLRYSMEDFAEHHEHDDDEMSGIRQLTKHYHLRSGAGTYTRVLYQELQQFEAELQVHASIENTLLFPRAQKLEQQVSRLVAQKARVN
jgi:regulator of cell morphogenesis and NO signaling